MPVSRWSGSSGMPPFRVPPFWTPPPPPPDDALDPDPPHPASTAATAASAIARFTMSDPAPSLNPCARVEPGVCQVDHRIGDDDEEGAVERQRHERRQVEVGDRLLRVLAHPLDAED